MEVLGIRRKQEKNLYFFSILLFRTDISVLKKIRNILLVCVCV
jgi:hypothetical protein